MLTFALDKCPVEQIPATGDELVIEEPRIVRKRGRIRIRTGIWLFIFGFLCISAIAFFLFYSEDIKRFMFEMTQGRIGIDPVEREINTLYSKAEIYLNQRNYDDAIASLEKALSLKPEDPKPIEDRLSQVFGERGDYYYANNNYQEAAESYEKAIELNSNIVDYHYNLGWSYYMIGRNKRESGRAYTNYYRRAIPPFKKAIEIDSGHVRSYNALARIYIKLNNQTEAIKMLQQIIRVAPDSREAKLAKKDLQSMTGRTF
jgi:tetratricopeptide (TPR) repeat protein